MKGTSTVARAIIMQQLPENAYLYPIIEVTRNVNIIGGGESASWQTWTTIRANGARLARLRIREDEVLPELAKLFPDSEIKEAGKDGKTRIYVPLPRQ